MSLELPAGVEPFGTEWHRPGVYAIRYAKPDNLTDAVDKAFDNRPQWFDALEECDAIVYVGEAANVMRRLEDHANQKYRKNVLSQIRCEPVGIESIEYHASKEDAEHAEYNTAVELNEQTDDSTLVLCNGEAL